MQVAETERGLSIELPPPTLDWLRKDGEEGEVYHGRIYLFGVPHHVKLIKVEEVAECDPPSDCEPGSFQEPVDDPCDFYNDVQRLNEGRLQTVHVPGLEGEYVMIIYPYAE